MTVSDEKVLRLDFAPLRKARLTPQGFLRVDASLGRTGVLTYHTKGDPRPRRELRLPEEVFRADSMASAAGAVVTDRHPPFEQALIGPANWKQWQIGFVGDDVRQDGQHIAGSLVIQDATAIDLITRGERREISPGYTCSLEMSAGRWDGQEYDCIQRNITYNSVGLGPRGWGRQGSEVALRLDSMGPTAAMSSGDGTALGNFIRAKMLEKQLTVIELAKATGIIRPKDDEPDPLLRMGPGPDRGLVLESIIDGWTPRPSDAQLEALASELDVSVDDLLALIPEELRQDSKKSTGGRASRRSTTPTHKEEPMATEQTELRLDGLTLKLDQRDAALVQKAIDDREKRIKDLTTDQSTLQARLDGLTEQHGKLKTELSELPGKLRAEMKERAALESNAARVLGAEARFDSKSDRQVREEVLKKLSPELKLDGKDDTYVAVRFDVAMEGFREPTASDQVRQAITGGAAPKSLRADSADADPAAARAKMIEENNNAWKRVGN